MTDNQEFPFEIEKLWSSVSNREAKEAIGEKLVGQASDGQVIGFGSGTTSMVCALAFGKAVKSGLNIKAVTTSFELSWLCESMNIEVLELVNGLEIDWCFDGADEIDAYGNMLKGRGGAMHRERQVFAAAKTRFVVADSSKDVKVLGEKFPAPIEVIPEKLVSVHSAFNEMNFDSVDIRMAGAGAKDGPVVTESGNVILDIVNRSGFDDKIYKEITSVDGVFDTGLFMGFDFERIS